MELNDYPRPPRDTGLGIHWAAVVPPGIGLAEVQQKWLPELLAMNIKWVKILHDGGEGLAKLFLAHEIMPIVRIYRHQPNPGRLSSEEQMRVKRFARLGVRYIETNNEPNLKEEWQPGEWEKGDLPRRVVEDWIADAEFVLSQGALPGFPALAPGGHFDDVVFFRQALQHLADRNGSDIFHAGAWIAIHNYFLNHPPDYPYDPVAQNGQPLSDQEKAHFALAPADVKQMNERRRQWRSPGRTLREDSNGFLKYQSYHDMFVDTFGFEVPLLTTEGGAVWGRAQDPRYPKIDETLHETYNLFAFEHMAVAPDYYFCNCPWLIANRRLNSGVRAWENNSWYSDLWAGGQLPIVSAIKDRAPWPVRTPASQGGRTGVITGRATLGQRQAVVVRQGGTYIASTLVGNDEQYRVQGLSPGTYRVEVPGTDVARDGVSVSSDTPARVDLTVPPKLGRIEGIARNGAGTFVNLYARSGGERRAVDRTKVGPDERFVFSSLWAGTYLVEAADFASATLDNVHVEGTKTTQVRLRIPRFTWKATITENSNGPVATQDKASVVQVHVIDRPPTDVRIYPSYWEGVTVRTGSKPEVGPFAAVADYLPAGTFTIEPVGLGVTTQVFLDGRGKAVVKFQQEEIPFADSAIYGRVKGGANHSVILERDQTEVSRMEIGQDESYRFSALEAGTYRVAVPTLGLWGEPVTLDGSKEVQIDFTGSSSNGTEGGTQTKPVAHYLLFGDPSLPGAATRYAIALPHLLRLGATFGYRQDDATQAKRVTIIGDTDAISAEVETQLREAGCTVQRIAGDEYALDAALAELGNT
ncbi:MAG: carboxypeptidase regulatory-like domain-containing protein [Chloroflexi bacterium]|nr:carboxypeptidase regulatory-like domain-containing protein [Chloroflexota bacterium]